MTTELPAELFQRLLDESSDTAIIIDQQGTIRYLNAASQALTGFPPAEAIGKPIDGLLPEGLAERHNGYLLNYVSGGLGSSVLGHVRDFAIRHRTGDMIPIQLKAVDLGVVDGVRYFGAFTVDMRERRAEEARNAALLAQLEQQAMTDALTALPNRRAFDAELARIAARARRNQSPISAGMADIDHFKQVNDRYGHPVGDLVLCEVAKAIERAARGTDFVARMGGEEFGMLFPDTSTEMARLVAERMRKAVAAASVTTPDGDIIRVTISIGLAALAPGSAPEPALASADAALYQAKEQGRDRVITAD
ncbi:sensor domain-containing diguanylate cyclase [Massilia eurypsychrophila]|jgi:diguanylate cyclase (GGDEF)-like protein/PAS domain S-box-containing protein|nr:sensor domain-containing diguanylate cyclase [Massilia eurypsychrophila]